MREESKDINNTDYDENYLLNFSSPEFPEIIVKDSNYYKNCIKKYILKLLVFFLFFLTYLLYFFSLEKCYDGLDICSTKLI